MTPISPPDARLEHPGGATELFLGGGALRRALPALEVWTRGRRVVVVTSRPVVEAQGLLVEEIESLGETRSRLLVADGEAAKTLTTAETLWEELLALGATRDSIIIGVGGGSVGDVAGFVAAAYLRGVAFALVPTTLLAQVDASVGGKTAVDLPGAKNAVGAFWHPDFVISDATSLASLPRSELRSGIVEIVKIAVAREPDLLAWLERNAEAVASGEAEALESLVPRAVRAKIRVVESDPNEGDERRVLNLGHTMGHAIEAALEYQQLRHGEAVAYGLLYALRLAVARGGDEELGTRCVRLLRHLDLPPLPSLEVGTLLEAVRRDKKVRGDGIFFVLPMAVGETEIAAIEPAEIERHLEGFLSDPWGL